MIILIHLVVLLAKVQKGFSVDQIWDSYLNCGATEEIPGDVRTKVPWVAGIFVQTSSASPHRFFVTGTIVGPSTVITVLGGAFGEPTGDGRKYSIPAPEQHRVAVGLPSSDLHDRDEHTQVVDVSNTVPYTGHEPGNQLYHLFIFQLKTPLNLSTPYARAACLPFNSAFAEFADYEDAWTSFVTAGGFVGVNNDQGASRKDLKGVSLLLDNRTVCEGEFTKRYGLSGEKEVHCGRLALGLRQEPICPSYGAAAVGFKFRRWTLLGILALHESGRSWCSPGTVFFFSRIASPWQWIWDFAGISGDKFACGTGITIELSRVCDQKIDCYNAMDEDPIYCRGRKPCVTRKKSFECGAYGPCLADEVTCNGRKDCPNGEDEDPKFCSSGQQGLLTKQSPPNGHCQPLEDSEGTILTCTDKYGERVSCYTELPPGTAAHYSCQEYYESSDVSLSTLDRTCHENGTWSPPANFKCTPECGFPDTRSLVPFIVGGQVSSKATDFPWHASLFREGLDSYKYICGGSLIEKNILMTAAHCIAEAPGKIDTETLRVVLGANSSDFNSVVLGSSTAQIFQVLKAWIPPSYDTLTLVGDIALLELDNNVVLDPHVRPVCYLKGPQRNVLSPGSFGRIPGFGFTEDGKVSEYLRYISYPIVSTVECLASLARAPPLSTFCAGYKNGTSVCQGDSGGGLVFPEQVNGVTRYILKGLVSHGDLVTGKPCNPFNYAVFTHVDAYAEWILTTLQSRRKLP